MLTREDVVFLFRHMEWADSLIWSSVRTVEAAQSDGVVAERLHHIHHVQRIYLQMWRGNPDEERELSSFSDIMEVSRWAQDYYSDLWAFVGTLEERALSRTIVFPWADELVKWFGEARTAILSETVLQVAMHTAHHRGQLATKIRQLGGAPPLVDLVGWIWMGKPAPEW